MSTITARFTFRSREYRGVTVLNPGACSGKSWLLVLDTSHTPELFVVEAYGSSSALDVLGDDEIHGDLIRIQDHERSDYGFRLSAGTPVGSSPLLSEAVVNLRGEVVTDPEAEYVREPQISPSGNYYDGESVLIYGDEGSDVPFACNYYGDDLPVEGASSKEYALFSSNSKPRSSTTDDERKQQ